jgi:hypothetical protein
VGHIAAEIHTEKLTGKVSRNITVTTDDPQRPRLTLKLDVEIVRSVNVLPGDVIRLGNRRGMPLGTKSMVLLRRDPTEEGRLEVRALRASVPWLVPRATRLDAARPADGSLPEGQPGDWLLELELSPDVPHGTSQAQIEFESGLAREPTVTLPISVYYDAPFRVPRQRLDLPLASGEPQSSVLIVFVRDDLDPAQLTAKATPPSLQATIEPVDGHRARLSIRWDRSQPEAGEIELRLGDYTRTVAVHQGTTAR